jgi:hypothetical protein
MRVDFSLTILELESESSTIMLVAIHKSTRHDIPDDRHLLNSTSFPYYISPMLEICATF